MSTTKTKPARGSAKERGAFFTPAAVADFLAKWAIRTPGDRILEPSCGEASFLVSAGHRLNSLANGSLFDDGCLEGVELHLPSVEHAHKAVAATGRSATIHQGDFFDVPASSQYDAVLGNPPFVRYQTFAGQGREKALRAAIAAGVNLSGLASSWAPFVVHASKFLKPTGRLGFVLPAEMLTVKYAAPIREYLMRRFARVRLVVFEELIFPDALEDVVLLLAEGHGGCTHFEVHQAKNAAELAASELRKWEITPGNSPKWSQVLVKPDTWSAFQEVLTSPHVCRLNDWGRAYLGTVTGDNNFFALTDDDVRNWKLTTQDLVAISPPGSRHLRGLEFAKPAWNSARAEGKRCWMFCPPEEDLSAAAEAYIEAGEDHDIDKAYKCKVRDPWYIPPRVAVADIFLTYMDHERPRLTTNSAGVEHLNSLYGISLHQACRSLGKELLPLASLNTLTLLSAEVVGRAYGGGLLKLEPTEAEQLALPSLKCIEALSSELRAIRPQAAASLRSGHLSDAVEIIDKVLFSDWLNVDTLTALRAAREFLFQRRSSKGRTSGQEEDIGE